MGDDASRMSSKYEKETDDLEVALMTDSNSDEKKSDFYDKKSCTVFLKRSS